MIIMLFVLYIEDAYCARVISQTVGQKDKEEEVVSSQRHQKRRRRGGAGGVEAGGVEDGGHETSSGRTAILQDFIGGVIYSLSMADGSAASAIDELHRTQAQASLDPGRARRIVPPRLSIRNAKLNLKVRLLGPTSLMETTVTQQRLVVRVLKEIRHRFADFRAIDEPSYFNMLETVTSKLNGAARNETADAARETSTFWLKLLFPLVDDYCHTAPFAGQFEETCKAQKKNLEVAIGRFIQSVDDQGTYTQGVVFDMHHDDANLVSAEASSISTIELELKQDFWPDEPKPPATATPTESTSDNPNAATSQATAAIERLKKATNQLSQLNKVRETMSDMMKSFGQPAREQQNKVP